MSGVTQLRPMHAEDIPAALDVMDTATADLLGGIGRKHTAPSEDGRARTVAALTRTLRDHPAGSFVTADADGALTGFAVSSRTGDQWGLALLFVAPEHQGKGLGRQLLGAAKDYGNGLTRVIVSSESSVALRSYMSLGLVPYPGLRASGIPRPALDQHVYGEIREGTADDLDTIEGIEDDNTTASRIDDVRHLVADGGRVFLIESGSAAGYAVIRSGDGLVNGTPVLMAADEKHLARDLLMWLLQNETDGGAVDLYGITGAHGWAAEAAHRCGLRLDPGPTVLYSRGVAPTGHANVHGLYF